MERGAEYKGDWTNEQLCFDGAECSQFLDSNTFEQGFGVVPIIPAEPSETELVQGTSSFRQAMFNGLNAMTGLCMLSMPYIMNEVGFVYLPIFLGVMMCSIYTISLLDRCQVLTGCTSFPDVATAAFGPAGQLVAALLCYFDLFSIGVGCMIISANSLNIAITNLTHLHMGLILSTLVTAISYLPACFLKDLSLVSYLSMGGMVANLVTVMIVMAVVASQVNWAIETGNGHVETKIFLMSSDIPINWFNFMMLKISQNTALVGESPFLPISLITYQFTMQSLFPSLRTSMRRPCEAQHMMQVVFAIVTFVVLVFSTFIYTLLGPAVPELITSALKEGVVGLAVNLTVLFNSYSKFPLGIFPICDDLIRVSMLSPSFKQHCSLHPLRLVATMRCAAVLFTLLTCILLPGFTRFIGFCAWVFAPSLVLVMPVACHLRLFYHELSLPSKVAHVVAVAVGIFGSFIGMIMTVRNGGI